MNRAAFRRIGFFLAGVSLVLGAAAASVATGIAQAKDQCRLTSVPTVAFGAYTGAQKDLTLSLEYDCGTDAREIYILLDTGPDPRQMLGAQPPTTSSIPYELYYQDPKGVKTVWTNTPSKTSPYYKHDPANDRGIPITLFARAFASSVQAGSHIDNLSIRLIWTANAGPNKGTVYEVTGATQVTANFAATCSVATTDLAFGDYDPLVVNSSGAGSDLDAQATINVNCSAGAAPLVWIAPGTSARIMTGPGSLNYELYSDAGRTVPWGSTAGTALTLPVSTGVAQPITVYGRIPRGQNVPVGAYSQTVTVTVNF